MKEADIYFHIGTMKTGTTFLQRNVFPFFKGVDYYHTDGRKFHWKRPITRKTLVSIEKLSGDPHVNSLDTRRFWAYWIHYNYPNAKIIVFFRIRNWQDSLYSTYIKDGGILKYKDWRVQVFNEDYLRFYWYIKLLQELFSEVLIIQYEDFKHDNYKTICRICDFMHIKKPEWYDMRQVGKSMSGYRLEILRWLNFLPVKRIHFVKWLDKLKLRGKIE